MFESDLTDSQVLVKTAGYQKKDSFFGFNQKPKTNIDPVESKKKAGESHQGEGSGLVGSAFIRPVSGACHLHGSYQSVEMRTPDGWVGGCPTCAMMASDRQRALDKINDHAINQEASIRRRIARSNIPEEHLKATMANYIVRNEDQRLTVMAVNEYIQKGMSRDWLVLTGNVGTGKSHLACAAAMQMARMDNNCGVMFLPSLDIDRRMKSTFGQRDVNERDTLNQMIRFNGVVVLDELGLQQGSDRDRQVTAEFIAGRHANHKPLIVTTNLEPQEIERFIGVQAFDRMRERGEFLFFDWESERERRASGRVD